MRSFRSLLAAAALTIAVQSSVSAQTLFFNGDPDGVDGVSSEQNTGVGQAMIYENFVISSGTWSVDGLFGDFYSDVNWTQAFWEIRSGVSEGNGGVLLHSGTSSASRVATGHSDFGYDVYRALVTGLGINLGVGEYWFGLSPIGTGSGRAFLTTTGGVNGVNPMLDNSYFFNSSSFGYNFAQNETIGPNNFSLGVGIPQVVETVPEPATMTLLATGLAGLAAKRRRKKA